MADDTALLLNQTGQRTLVGSVAKLTGLSLRYSFGRCNRCETCPKPTNDRNGMAGCDQPTVDAGVVTKHGMRTEVAACGRRMLSRVMALHMEYSLSSSSRNSRASCRWCGNNRRTTKRRVNLPEYIIIKDTTSIWSLTRAEHAACWSTACSAFAAAYVLRYTSDANHDILTILTSWLRQRRRMRSIQVQVVRDIFGNPFRPATFDPSWRTSTVIALARQMYASRNFSAMPILADALGDAGCENEDILNHCRQTGTHVKGCWVVDLLLGKG